MCSSCIGFWCGLLIVFTVQVAFIAGGACLGFLLGSIPTLFFYRLGAPLATETTNLLIYLFGAIFAIIAFSLTLWMPKLYWKKLYEYRYWSE